MSALLDYAIDAAQGGAVTKRMAHTRNVLPWHGPGREIPAGATADEIAAIIGADADPVAMDMTIDWQGKRITVPGHRAIVDQYGRILSVMGAGYKVHSPRRMMDFFLGYLQVAGAESGLDLSIETAGFLDGGKQMFVTSKVPENARRIKDECIDVYVNGATSFDGSLSTTFQPSAVCQVCSNTVALSLAENKRRVGIKHSTELTPEVLAEARTLLARTNESIGRFLEVGEMLAETPMTREETRTVVQYLSAPKWFAKQHETSGAEVLRGILDAKDNDALALGLLRVADAGSQTVYLDGITPGVNDMTRVGNSILDEILNGPGSDLDARRDTAWGVLNGITGHWDHKAGRAGDTAVASSMFGVGAKSKTQAVELLTAIATLKQSA